MKWNENSEKEPEECSVYDVMREKKKSIFSSKVQITLWHTEKEHTKENVL